MLRQGFPIASYSMRREKDAEKIQRWVVRDEDLEENGREGGRVIIVSLFLFIRLLSHRLCDLSYIRYIPCSDALPFVAKALREEKKRARGCVRNG